MCLTPLFCTEYLKFYSLNSTVIFVKNNWICMLQSYQRLHIMYIFYCKTSCPIRIYVILYIFSLYARSSIAHWASRKLMEKKVNKIKISIVKRINMTGWRDMNSTDAFWIELYSYFIVHFNYKNTTFFLLYTTGFIETVRKKKWYCNFSFFSYRAQIIDGNGKTTLAKVHFFPFSIVSVWKGFTFFMFFFCFTY